MVGHSGPRMNSNALHDNEDGGRLNQSSLLERYCLGTSVCIFPELCRNQVLLVQLPLYSTKILHASSNHRAVESHLFRLSSMYICRTCKEKVNWIVSYFSYP